MRITSRVLAILLLSAGPSWGAVTDLATNGFEIEETVHIAASPQTVYTLAIRPSQWWSSSHTYSGSAANLSFEAKADGCWCERLADGGTVRHMTVTFVQPGKSVVLRGALGPLIDLAVEGAMRWTIKPAGAETEFTLTYRVSGYIKDGFGIWPKAIDGVLGEQIAGLKRAAEAHK